MRGSRKFSQCGVQIPRRCLTENFNMAKINNLAIPGGVGPLVSPSGSAHAIKKKKKRKKKINMMVIFPFSCFEFEEV